MSYTEAEIARAWDEALALWDVKTELSPPEALAGSSESHWNGDEPLAFIDLVKRQVVMNFELLEKLGAKDSLRAVLAHEIGHHVRFPHSLGLCAELEVLQNKLIPGLKQSLTNLFFDLQVNEHVGRTDKEGLAKVYQGFITERPGDISELFFFYLAVYEELWGYEPGTLVPKKMLSRMEKAYPGCRADARIFAQTFYDLPTVQLQFVYFCSRMLRYIPKPSELDFQFPLAGDVPIPSAEDIDGALQRSGALDDTIEDARQRGWLEEGQSSGGKTPLDQIADLASRRPGKENAEFQQLLVEKHYARLVEKHLIPLPHTLRAPEAELMTTTEPWELGDAPGAIDWGASVLRHGALAPLSLLKRSLEPDGKPTLSPDPIPAVEIYLDTSGSMPNPAFGVNAMTLAALVLATSALRRKARVRAIIYSMTEIHSGWMYDERAARKYLLQYAGGGTLFPFPLLKKFIEEEPGVIRVVISDGDFLHNVKDGAHHELLVRAAERSERIVYLLNWVDPIAATRELGAAVRHKRAKLAAVKNAAELAKTAAELADALIPLPQERRA